MQSDTVADTAAVTENALLREQLEDARARAADLSRGCADADARAAAATRTAERAQRLLELSTALNKAIGASEVADLICETGIAAAGADAGSFSLITQDDDGNAEFEIIRTRGFTNALENQYHRFALRAGRPLSDAVLTRAPVLVRSIAEARVRYPSLTDVGYEAFVSLPVLNGGRAVAGITFSFREQQYFDEPTVAFLSSLGEQCAEALERARFYDARDRQAEREGLLAYASQVLASSLDYETTLQAFADAAVPVLGDWCAVDITENPSRKEWPPTLRRLAVAHADPASKVLRCALQDRCPVDWDSRDGLAAALRDGTTRFIPLITDEILARIARGPEHLAAIREAHLSSVIIVPLVARGLTLGALTLVMANSGRRYQPDDAALATDLAMRAATAIDNARLFREAQRARMLAEEAMARAASASAAKSTFLATMSHEIRTPINAVLGYSELLELELPGPLTVEQRAQIGRIRASTEHLLTLVNEVLDLAKIESGTLRVEITEAAAGDTMNAALSLVTPQAAAKGVNISDHCEGDCGARYVGDPARVRQVLANLMSNAVKFTKPGGMVHVACCVSSDVPHGSILHADTPHIAFRITDTGIGIPAGQLEHIFEAFVQAEVEGRSPYTREQAGTGLGLAISQQLAHGMGGEIVVESEVGTGSTFTLFMPAAATGA